MRSPSSGLKSVLIRGAVFSSSVIDLATALRVVGSEFTFAGFEQRVCKRQGDQTRNRQYKEWKELGL